MLTIDSDGHLHEPFDLFDRYIEKEFQPLRPRVIDMPGEARDQGPLGGRGEGGAADTLFQGAWAAAVFNYPTPRHKQMKARDNSLDDIPGRLDDLDRMGVDYQVVFPTALVWVFDLENAELAGAVCRAYNNYVAEQCSQASKRLNAIAMVPVQDPAGAAEEARRAVKELGLAGVLLPGMARPPPAARTRVRAVLRRRGRARHPHRLPRGHRHARYALGRLLHRFLLHPRHGHAVLHDGGHDVGGAPGHHGPLSQPALRLPGDRRHLVPLLGLVGGQAHRARARAARRRTPRGQLGPGALHPARESIREPMEDILAGRILSGFEDDENLRSIIDQVGAESLMYASDYPHSDMDWGRVDAIKSNDSITQEEKDALLGGNARRFYKLEL